MEGLGPLLRYFVVKNAVLLLLDDLQFDFDSKPVVVEHKLTYWRNYHYGQAFEPSPWKVQVAVHSSVPLVEIFVAQVLLRVRNQTSLFSAVAVVIVFDNLNPVSMTKVHGEWMGSQVLAVVAALD